jgi:hypothetical protein
MQHAAQLQRPVPWADLVGKQIVRCDTLTTVSTQRTHGVWLACDDGTVYRVRAGRGVQDALVLEKCE